MADARHAAFLNALGVDVYVARGRAVESFERGAVRSSDTAKVAAVRSQGSHDFRPDEEIGRAESIRTQRPGRSQESRDVRPHEETGGAESIRTQRPGRSQESRDVRPNQETGRLEKSIRIERPVTASPLGSPGAGLDWEALRSTVAACERCALHATRTQTVFGVGNPKARWMFIGEAPGADEDRQGEPFVGRAGQLLTSMIRALGMQREDVYIANVLKCRPPDNRDPRPDEALACRSFLERQVELVDPTLIIAVGRICAQSLLATETPIAKLRGKVHTFGARSWPLVVTYHPAYLLRSPSEKRKSWQDLLFARQTYARLERDKTSESVENRERPPA